MIRLHSNIFIYIYQKLALRCAEVELTSPKLTGDIKAFEEIPNLVNLSLHGTRIHGNLSALANLQLQFLDLSGTAVTGDFNTLTRFQGLKVADLSHTAVTGRMTNEWRGKLKRLEILKLQNTSVQFAPQGEELQKLKVYETRQRPLLALKELDLSNCTFAKNKMCAATFWFCIQSFGGCYMLLPCSISLHVCSGQILPLRSGEQPGGELDAAAGHMSTTHLHPSRWCWHLR